ncbi:MAG: aminomethyl-transferring glycine dehydrogenase subunit GcvPB [Alphaproteobacteria bacterium]|jgi:glycine dehydrogenase subunit 2|nr:aminomethyl-transferring glycine dehydrogenase subunit GcvPB [Alphaproteobacteria bacterium]MBP9876832.1 aminomethyl-transferring glycine dehydrogenase subunit GcvPB [Alphaproteobacteria bacterium]
MSQIVKMQSSEPQLDLKKANLEEPLIFELSIPGSSGIDCEDRSITNQKFGGLPIREKIGLPDVPEPLAVRHYTRLSQQNYAIDSVMYPLGSCTMKYNPRLNEKMARLEGFAQLHPLQDDSQTQGALELIHLLQEHLLNLTGLGAAVMSPSAGAHGELCGMMAIKAALKARGEEHRLIVLVPESAHGTNPATAMACGFQVISIKANEKGQVDLADFKEKCRLHAQNLAGMMLTNPNTCGIFEQDIVVMAKAIHEAGGYFYGDGANFNAIMGRVRPGDLGIDVLHLNLHKTFSTPHGGGGPGAGPVFLAESLAPYAPYPRIVKKSDGSFALIEQDISGNDSPNRLRSFVGQMGMFIRAYTYILSLGIDGIRQASGDAVLNANYVKASLADLYNAPFSEGTMHEVLFDDSLFAAQSVTTLDIAKALIDEGFHPMTIYFPLVVKGAMLIEPTETESKKTLDAFITAMRKIAQLAHDEGAASFAHLPQRAHRTRLDETRAAREPILVDSKVR